MGKKKRKDYAKRRPEYRSRVQKNREIDAAWEAHNRSLIPSFGRHNWLKEHVRRQSKRCAYCDVVLKLGLGAIKSRADRDRVATIDHIVPTSKGGADTFENTVAACEGCNKAKSDLEVFVFLASSSLLSRRKWAATPPDRLSTDERSPFYDADLLERGVGVRFNQRDRDDVVEYSVSEGWIRVPIGKTKDRYGYSFLVTLRGIVDVYFRT